MAATAARFARGGWAAARCTHAASSTDWDFCAATSEAGATVSPPPKRTKGTGGRSRLQLAQAVDCADWLPNDLLTKVDRCLMVHGVEGRTPFLDPEVAAVAFRLPDRLKVRDGLGKWLLRKWLDDRLPNARAFDKKRGFTVPVGAWIAAHGKRLGPLVAAQPGIAELCDEKAVIGMYQRRGRRIGRAAWTLLFYALWHNAHIIGRPSDGDVFEVLDASAA